MEQFFKLPHDMTVGTTLTVKDLWIYLQIKKYDNEEHKCFPSLATISQDSGVAINTVRKAVSKLVQFKYLETKRVGKCTFYYFLENGEHFEQFSKKFLDLENVSTMTKSFLIGEKQHMVKDIPGIGKISYSDRQIAKLLNMSHAEVSRCNKELANSGLLTTEKLNTVDPITGCKNILKIVDLNSLFLHTVKQVQENTKDIEKANKHIDDVDKRIENVNERMDNIEDLLKTILKNQNSEQNKSLDLTL